MSDYESDRLLAEYLLFHYGTPQEVLPYPSGPHEALGYPERCAAVCAATAGPTRRALDLGCAVGRSSFELARHFDAVVGIDLSRRFIEGATMLKEQGELAYERVNEGVLTTPLVARVPAEIDRKRVHFEVGDATALRGDLGTFDAVLMANLIDRVREPARLLARLPELVAPGGVLFLSSPYTWLEEFTPRENWLGGFAADGRVETTLEALTAALAPAFEPLDVQDMPFLIREHARKFQWSVAQASRWRRVG